MASDIFSILQSSYSTGSSQPLFSPGSKFAKVDPTKWEGTWTGKDFKNQPFTVRVSNVKGFRAVATLQDSAGFQEQQVFITTRNSFRIGDSSFTLQPDGKAKLLTIVTDPNTGIQTANTAFATRKT
jgi:hypothetical protein